MKTYLAGFLFLAAALYWLTGCADSKPPTPLGIVSAPSAPFVVPGTLHAAKPKPQLTPAQRDSVTKANKARASSMAAKVAASRAAKAQADSLRIVSHTPCPVTEIPKPNRARRSKACPEGCERKTR